MKKNCWEFKKCGREEGGSKAKELGVCPTFTETKYNGQHSGKNAGRCCWIVAETVYENPAGTYDYELTQYYSESFTVYDPLEALDYTHTFDLDDYSLVDDFTNLQVYKVIALKPTLEEFEIIGDGINYDIIPDYANKQIRIIDLIPGDGDLQDFDLITPILSYSYGPVSTSSEIKLTQAFYGNYTSDAEATFYDYLTISFSYSALSGENLFEEDHQTITSSATSFEYIEFSRNPSISTNNKLNSEGSEIFIDFEMFYDPYNVIYEADIDMDGKKDYKQEIDVDKDGRFDITKYGVEDPEDPYNIIWYTIIQDYVSEEVIIDKSMEEEKRTEWFDIDDKAFADYELNIFLLLISILVLPLLLYTLSTMVLPDVDYWAQKSLKQETTETQYIKSHYYSIRRDDNLDGYTDTQIDYERSNKVVQYESKDYEKTIITAKPQNIFSFIGDWISMNIMGLLGAPPKDLVFNALLTEDKLDNNDFSGTLIPFMNPVTASTLEATYRKFTKDTSVTYTSEFVQEKITVTDWVDGQIEQTRVYQDIFDEGEIDSDVIESLTGAIYTIQKVKVGTIQEVQSQSVYSTRELSITDPVDEEWDLETWEENIPVRFDSLTTISSDGTTLTQNKYEETITIEIPSRFSLYNDLYSNDPSQSTQFTITGMLITPSDGMVYDTSNKELFKSGAAKSPGKYFYFDSDNDGFYETVYVLENPVYVLDNPSRYGLTGGRILDSTIYRVKSIGFNYDGEHAFSPYRKVNRRIESETDFDQLEAEGTQRFGSSFWAYNFKGLKSIELLFPEDPFDGFEIQDHIFEISKLVRPSDFNSKFPDLFYEVRHRTYSDSWEIYKKQLAQDVIEQVFMTITATIVSAAVNAFFKATIILAPLAELFGTLAYIGVYTLLTKFNMDIKRHQAQSMERANTYIPISVDDLKPISLNERSLATHGYWEESTIAALWGHPGAYYTKVQGEANNQIYEAYAIASPANLARDNGGKNWGGFGAFIWDNMWKAAGSNPDLMVGLDFDAQNLDYFLLTTELPSLNDDPNYTFESSSYNWLYNQYRHNTIGYLQQKVTEETDADLSLIKPMIVGGVPQYVFIDGTSDFNHLTMPASHLYQPVIISSEQNTRNEGTITVNIRTAYTSNTKGISHTTTFPERNLYPSKVPLSSHGFEYPIKFIKLELIEEPISGDSPISVIDITLTSRNPTFRNFFYVESGNIYFNDNIDTILVSDQAEFNQLIFNREMAANTKKYYKLTIKFDMIVPDSGSEEHKRMALSQATAYGIMDYMNQWTFAKQTADMISEIAYTETMTLISTAISTAAIYFGSWAASGVREIYKKAAKASVKTALKEAFKKISLSGVGMGLGNFIYTIGVASIKEMFEEIIIDGIIESWGERIIKQLDGSEDQAFWFTTLLTSVRERLGGARATIMKAIGNIKIGSTDGKIDLRSWYANNFGTSANSDIVNRNEANAVINNDLKNGKNDQDILHQEEKVNSWKKLIGSGLFKILRTVIPAFFMGGFLFGNTFATLSMVSGIKGFAGSLLGRYQTLKVNEKKHGYNDALTPALKSIIDANSKLPKSKIEGLEQGYLEKNGESMTAIDISVIFNSDFMKEEQTSQLEAKFPSLLEQSISSGFMGSRIYLDKSYDTPKKDWSIDNEKTKLAKVDELKDSKNINPKIKDSKVSTSNKLPFRYISDQTQYKGQILKWSHSKTAFVADDFTAKGRKVDSALRLASRVLGMERGRKVSFIINDQIVALYNTIENVKGDKLLITQETTFEGVLDFLDYSTDLSMFESLGGKELTKYIKSNTIDVIYDSHGRALDLAKKHDGFAHIYKKYNYWFKSYLDRIVTDQDNDFENAELFDQLHDYISNLVHYLGSKLKIDSKGQLDSLMKSHFEEFLANEDILNLFPADKKGIYEEFVKSLYKQLTEESFAATTEEKVLEIVEDRLYLTALETIMTKGGIKNKDVSVSQLLKNIGNLLKTPGELFSLANDFYFKEAPKQLFLNSMFEVFLSSEMRGSKVLGINRHIASVTGFGTERKYLFEILPGQLVSWFTSLMNSFTGAQLKTISIHMYDEFIFDPNNNIFGLKFGSLNFYKGKSSRNFDGGGIFDFISFIVSTAIKGTWYDSISYDRQFSLVSGLANDGVSAMILDVFSNIANGKSIGSLPSRIVQLIAPYAVLYTAGSNKFTNVKTLSHMKLILNKFFSKNSMDNLGYKLANHEVFLVKVVESINSELDKITQPITERSIKIQISKIFEQDEFQKKIKSIAKSSFTSNHFYNQLDKGTAMKDLEDSLLLSENFNKLVSKTPSGIIRLSYLLNYNPHFKTNNEIKGSDFKLGGATQVLVKQGTTLIIQEVNRGTELSDKGPLIVGHSLDINYKGKVILIPLSLLNEINTMNIKEGYKDSDDNIHHSIFASDSDGKKLNSRLEFTANSYTIRAENWANNFYQYSESLRGPQIIGHESNFYAAYVLNSGDVFKAGLQDTTVILEHINPVNLPLPNVKISKKKSIKEKNFYTFKTLTNTERKSVFREDFTVDILNDFIYKVLDPKIQQQSQMPTSITLMILEYLNGKFEGVNLNKFKKGLSASDINAKVKDLQFTINELRKLAWKDSDGNFIGDGQYTKEWLELIYGKIMSYDKNKIGADSMIVKEQGKLTNLRDNFPDYAELVTVPKTDLAKREFSTDQEWNMALEIFKSAENIFGHGTIRFMLSNMVGFNNDKTIKMFERPPLKTSSGRITLSDIHTHTGFAPRRPVKEGVVLDYHGESGKFEYLLSLFFLDSHVIIKKVGVQLDSRSNSYILPIGPVIFSNPDAIISSTSLKHLSWGLANALIDQYESMHKSGYDVSKDDQFITSQTNLLSSWNKFIEQQVITDPHFSNPTKNIWLAKKYKMFSSYELFARDIWRGKGKTLKYLRSQIEDFRIETEATNTFGFSYHKKGSGILPIGGQNFELRLTQSQLDQINYITWGAKYTSESGSIVKYIYQKLNTNFNNFIVYAMDIISKFGTKALGSNTGSKVLIQPVSSTHDSSQGYQHYITAENFRNKLKYLPFEKTVFEIDLAKPIETTYILNHIANIMATYETIFVFRPWTDINNDIRYKDITNREERMRKYFADNKEAIVGIDFEGPIPFEDIFSQGGIEKLSIDSYIADDQGHTFFDREVQRDIKDWNEVWKYKMGLSMRGGFNYYYFKEIMNGNSHRAEELRRILGIGLKGARSIDNQLPT